MGDTNQDGKISLDEFVSWWRLGRHTKLRKAFKLSMQAQAMAAKVMSNSATDLDKKHQTGNLKTLVDIEYKSGEPTGKTNIAVSGSLLPNEEVMGLLVGAFPDNADEITGDNRMFLSVIWDCVSDAH